MPVLLSEDQLAQRRGGEYDTADRASITNYGRFANALVNKWGLVAGSVDMDDVNTMVMLGR